MPKPELKILFQDNHIIVVDKPPGLATMGARAGEPSLAAQIKAYLKATYKKPGNVYLGVVSRLDAFAAGVIVFARTSKAAGRLAEQFKHGQVIKDYLAIVAGELVPASGKLVDWLRKDDAAKKMIVVPESDAGAKRAELKYRTLGVHGGKSLLGVSLLTGRKHQIRVQLSHRRAPIVGDAKYGSNLSFPAGIALHARSVTIEHPVRKKPLTFESLPRKSWDLGRFGFNPGKGQRKNG